MARTLILCPTFTHADTLYASIASVQAQVNRDWTMVVIGDGAPPRTREIVEAFASWDSRITFRAYDKGPGYGEIFRDAVIRDTEADCICHLGDDDLWSDRHLDSMLDMLDGADWAMAGVLRLARGGPCEWRFANTGTAALRAAAVRDPALMCLGGLNNVAMRRDAYLRLPQGWGPALPGKPSDTTNWSRVLANPWLRVASSATPSFLKLAGHGARAGDSPPLRLAEMAPLLARINRAGWLADLRAEAALTSALPRALALSGAMRAATLDQALDLAGLRATTADQPGTTGIDGAPIEVPLSPDQHEQLALVWGIMRPDDADLPGLARLARRWRPLLSSTLRELLAVDALAGLRATGRVRDGLGLPLPATRAEVEHLVRIGDRERATAALDATGLGTDVPWVAALRTAISEMVRG